ncbi:SAM-dependent methyltransferase [Sphingomonas sp. CCH10-B3]|uniref:SAM-dependent methyltransferase n=1 Tax=Sphingomonas sp. CCH10-B3 TaxID=1768757 RepID=UPI000834FFFE|nr:cyclopropane-fatty-acyl-phospholipid synthase family protein [Sphingomonas sp. CCH10-B3]
MNATIPVSSVKRRELIGFIAPFFLRLIDKVDAGIAAGSIEARLPNGQTRLLGGRGEGPAAHVELRSWQALARLAIGGSSGWYVAWTRGEWASPDPVAVFEVFSRNRRTLGETGRSGGVARLAKRAFHWLHRNNRGGARRNIEAHYDLGNDFYAAWLDPTLTYSSALFDGESADSLEAAQRRKLAAMLDRTATAPGERILEIGCGWGSFAAQAAAAGRQVHAITLSSAQEAFVAARGLPGVTVALTDYRDVTGSFDAVVSIEMVEAVGQDYWPAYLAAIARLLKPGGRAAIQFIAIDDAIFDSYAANVDFVQAYVFPGGMLLSESRFRALAEAAGFDWVDRVAFGADYAETLRRWRRQFDEAVSAGALPPRFDSNFIDLWRYYLMYCEGGFRGGGLEVAQVTLVKR